MNHEKTKKSRSAPSGGIIAWLYELLFPPKNTAADESSISPARETIPEHDNGRAEKLFAQMQQEQEGITPTMQAASLADTRMMHQDDTGSHHAASASDGSSSSSSSDSDSGSSSGGD
jgi:hypothetical protein